MKMKLFKKAISLCLALMMVVTLVPLTVVQTEAASNIVISGVDIGYANGDYFTKNGSTCKDYNNYDKEEKIAYERCHKRPGYDCSKTTDPSCNCMRYWPTGNESTCQVNLLGSQCLGFARYCQWRVYGSFATEASNIYSDLTGAISKSDCTASNLKSKLLGCAPATHVRMPSPHSISVLATSDSSITFADCNSDGCCKIRVVTWDWDTFATYVKGKGGITYTYSRKGVAPAPSPSSCTCSTSYAGIYICTTSDANLNIRSGHGSSYGKVGSIPSGATVTVTKASGTGSSDWAHVEYNGVSGYASMQYLSQVQGSDAIFEGMHPIDLGADFTAVILNYEYWKPIENSYIEGDKPPIRIGVENNCANQVWRFTRQSDGSYRIASCYDGKYMDVRDASTEPCTVVQTCVETSSDAQKWYIYERSDGYVFKSKLNDYVLDLKNNDSATGTILQTYGWNGSGAQQWAIYRGDECKLSDPELTTVQKPTGEVVFYWTNVYGEKGYDIKIWRDELWEGEAYHIEWGVSSGWSIKLPDGTYHAYVDARNYYETKMSNEVTFTVSHVHSYSSYVTPPTCTTQGYTTYTCITCNDSYKADYIDETGHSYSYKVTKDPTTSATGTVTGTCSKCKGTTTATLPKLNTTDYTYSVVKEATCIEMGLCRYTWSDPRYGSFNFEVTIPKSDPELGDVDADAKITIGDVSALLNFLSDTTRKPGGVTDINQDGVITVGDVTMLLNTLAGIIK
ncbi:MAG: RICIN domain-containing protein [Clostridia bacterium]|nr:RICIN domain-containing protein [Clostridia bacterium]